MSIALNPPPRENAYGHAKRLRWLAGRIEPSDRVLEFGCGTGLMITRPLLAAGVDVRGLDTDAASIKYGAEVLEAAGLEGCRLVAADVASLEETFDVVIASEVLEHIPDEHLSAVIAILRERLRPGGRLLVTVPNGYGWFEVESWLWYRLGVGRALEALRVTSAVRRMKRFLRVPEDEDPVSSLDSSRHVQRFTIRSLRRLLERNGFAVEDATGTTLCSGPFSDLAFRGIGPLMRLNGFLGSLLPAVASGFLVSARLTEGGGRP